MRAFADMYSPRTVANLRANLRIEVNVVDPIARKGHRLQGMAAAHTDGTVFKRGMGLCRERGVVSAIRSIVTMQVTPALPMNSPAYGAGRREADVRALGERYFASIKTGADRDTDAANDSGTRRTSR
jgi:hypothetical protein